jgi:hypothetical protein
VDDTVFCGACGSRLNASAKFCTSCGAPQDEFERRDPPPPAGEQATQPAAAPAEPATVQLPREPAPAAAPPQPPAGPRIGERIEQVTPGAGEFAGELAAQLNTPGVMVALAVAASSAVACFAVGLLLAIALPDSSVLSLELYGNDVGTIEEAFGQMLSLLLVSFDFGELSLHVGPLLFALVPTMAAAVAAARQAERTRGMAPWQRIAWASAAGVPFVLAVVVALIVASDLDPSAGGAILLGLLWVGVGGALGTLYALRREGVELTRLLPAKSLPALRTAAAAMPPLLIVLALTTIVGLAFSYVQTLRDEPFAGDDRSIPTALVDSTLLSVDNGVNYAALGAGAKFDDGWGSPIPVDIGESFEDFDGGFRLFDYSGPIAAWIFVPLLILLIGTMALGALYAGFSVARRGGARNPGPAAAYGALTGPIWAVVAVIACAAHVKLLGHPDGDSVFVTFLLGGAALGALGGLLSAGASAPGTQAPDSR